MHAPAAARNQNALCQVLKSHGPSTGQALEVASGTGQHVVAFARMRPDVTWQPTELDHDRLASIDAYRAESGLQNIKPAKRLDATQPDWGETNGGKDLIVLVNLLHLIDAARARHCVAGAMTALKKGGRFVLYGPFLRKGQLISAADARFHAQLSSADPTIGYKNDVDVDAWLRTSGSGSVTRLEMPANNIAFVATR